VTEVTGGLQLTISAVIELEGSAKRPAPPTHPPLLRLMTGRPDVLLQSLLCSSSTICFPWPESHR